jgi:glycosyltransferase involved in cell wall biosynthesis
MQPKGSKSMLVSIITIVYNSDKTLENTIKSVLQQTYPNIEYVLIDGASTDDSLSIIKKYEKSLKWISEPDKGISDAFNKGIRMCTGDLIGIINADDWYQNDAVETIVKHFNEQYDIYCGNINLIDNSDNIFKLKKSKVGYLNLGMHIMHPSVFVTKRVYEKAGLFDIKYKIAMDYDMLLRIKKSGFKFKYIDHPIANMRLTGASADVRKMHAEELQVMQTNLSGWSYILGCLSNYTNRMLYHFFRLVKG